MVQLVLNQRTWRVGAIAAATCTVLMIGTEAPVTAQSLIVPDDTLGAEQSQVLQNFGGLPIEVILGGAQRSQNLFHSFEEFNVDEGRGALFFSPDDVNNIFSRVTGSNPSNILGLLGTFGSDADLFFINPNGILFGPNSSLNVQGSFAALTADAIQFGEQGFFSASNPEIPSELLTINPSALFFSQIPSGTIASTSTASAGVDPSGSFGTFGLRVPDGRSLLLVGGDIDLSRGGLIAFGGQIELSAVEGTGTLGLNIDGNRLAVNVPEDVQRADIALADNAALLVAAGNGGDVAINSRNLSMSGRSTIRAGILSGLGSANTQGGDIRINTTGTTELSNALLLNNIEDNAQGNTGQIEITTGSLSILNGAQILAVVRGEGDAGPITITADESVTLDGRNINNFPSLIASTVEANAVGSAGNITVAANVLEITNRAQLNSSTSGLGDAGNIRLEIDDQIVLNNSIILSEVSDEGGIGTGGNITITTNSLELLNGSALLADGENQGNAGRIRVTANDFVTLSGEGPSASDPNLRVSSQISTTVERNAVGTGGDIEIETGSLSITDGGFIRSSTFGQGNAGRIVLEARDTIVLDGRSTEDDSPSGISTNIEEAARGNSGRIEISTGELQITDRAQISSTVAGSGNSAGLIIRADDSVFLSNSLIITEVVEGTGNGDGGDITITTGSLEIRDGSSLLADTESMGDAGSITIAARENIILAGIGPSAANANELVPSQISTTVESAAMGDGGDIAIATDQLILQDGGFISSELFGAGDAGDIDITNPQSLQLTDRAVIVASTGGRGDAGDIRVQNAGTVSLMNSGISTTVNQTGVGQGGRIIIDADNLELGDRAQITSSTAGQGDTGVIQLRVTDSISVSNSSISSEVSETANGQGQDITIQTDDLNLDNNALISAQSFRTLDLSGSSRTSNIAATETIRGDAGNIQIVVDDLLTMSDSDITTQAAAFAGGEITIRAGDMRLLGDSDITSNVQSGVEGGGDITLMADSILAFDDSDILAFAQDGIGGDITLDTPAFFGENFDPAASASDSVDTLDGNDRVDINATGAIDGVVTLPDVSFIQNSLNDLPEGIINTESLIANSCVVRNEDGSSTFIVTGTGGLPEHPGGTDASDFPTGDVQSISDTPNDRESNWEPGDPIVEAQRVYQLPNGELVMSHTCR